MSPRFYLITKNSAARKLFSFLFWLWGTVGFLVNFFALMEMHSKLTSSSGIGVGSSAYQAAITLIWIGGMFFFGVGALLCSQNYDVTPSAENAR
jgi:hypothetical protein